MSDNHLSTVVLHQEELQTLYPADGNFSFEIPLSQSFRVGNSGTGQVHQVLQTPGMITLQPPTQVSVTEIGHFLPPLTDATEMTRGQDTSSPVCLTGQEHQVLTISIQHPGLPADTQPSPPLLYPASQSQQLLPATTAPKPAKPSRKPAQRGGDNLVPRQESRGAGEEKTVFPCDQCSSTFKRLSNLKVHLQRHLGHKPHACPQCSAAFVEEKNLKRHMVAHRTDRPHVCQECGMAFVESGNLTRHMVTHTGVKDFVCEMCGAAFSKAHHLKDHLALHQGLTRCSNKELSCEECHEVFNNRFQLRKHIKGVHSRGVGHPYVCKQCGRAFGWWTIFRRHLLTHKGEKPFVCDKCGRGFTDHLALRQHKRTHARDRVNECDVCSAAFDRPSHLTRHRRVHTGEKPNVCSECGAAFLERNKLARHMRVHDGDCAGGGGWVCEQCGARFSRARHLTHHMRSHGEGLVSSTSRSSDAKSAGHRGERENLDRTGETNARLSDGASVNVSSEQNEKRNCGKARPASEIRRKTGENKMTGVQNPVNRKLSKKPAVQIQTETSGLTSNNEKIAGETDSGIYRITSRKLLSGRRQSGVAGTVRKRKSRGGKVEECGRSQDVTAQETGAKEGEPGTDSAAPRRKSPRSPRVPGSRTVRLRDRGESGRSLEEHCWEAPPERQRRKAAGTAGRGTKRSGRQKQAVSARRSRRQENDVSRRRQRLESANKCTEEENGEPDSSDKVGAARGNQTKDAVIGRNDAGGGTALGNEGGGGTSHANEGRGGAAYADEARGGATRDSEAGKGTAIRAQTDSETLYGHQGGSAADTFRDLETLGPVCARSEMVSSRPRPVSDKSRTIKRESTEPLESQVSVTESHPAHSGKWLVQETVGAVEQDKETDTRHPGSQADENSEMQVTVVNWLEPILTEADFASDQTVSASTQAVSVTTLPFSMSTRGVSVSAQSLSKPTQAVSMSTLPFSASTQAISMSTLPFSASTQAVSMSTLPFSASTQAVSMSTLPFSASTQAVSMSTLPFSASTQAVSMSTLPFSASTQAVSMSTLPLSSSAFPPSAQPVCSPAFSTSTEPVCSPSWTLSSACQTVSMATQPIHASYSGQEAGSHSGQGTGSHSGQEVGFSSGQEAGSHLRPGTGSYSGQVAGSHSGQEVGFYSGQEAGSHSGQGTGSYSGQEAGSLSDQTGSSDRSKPVSAAPQSFGVAVNSERQQLASSNDDAAAGEGGQEVEEKEVGDVSDGIDDASLPNDNAIGRVPAPAGYVLFPCSQCCAAFNSSFSLQLHKRVHKTRTAVCLRCGRVFARPGDLARHRQSCAEFPPPVQPPAREENPAARRNVEPAAPPPSPGSAADNPGAAKRLTASRAEEGPTTAVTTAAESENVLPSSGMTDRHSADSGGAGSGARRPHGCEQCGARFAHVNQLKLHAQLHARAPQRKKFACAQCGAAFAKSTDLRAHVRTHTGSRPFVCGVCGSSYTQSSTLSVHARTHTGHKPFVCKVCGAAFPRHGRLKVHMRCHSGEKPCVCKLCGAAFKWSQTLLRHVRTAHGDAPFRCDQCREVFHHEAPFRAHQQTHRGERPFPCGQCGKAFKQLLQLGRHSFVHTGEWPFLCEECGAGFGSAASLKIHTRSHSGEKPFVCERCGRAFRISSHLTRHMKTHTDDPVFVRKMAVPAV